MSIIIKKMNKNTTQVVIIRLALAFIFLTFGIWEIVQPDYWSGFVPPFVLALFGHANLLVMIHGIVLVLLGLGFLIGYYLWYVALVAALVLAQIIISMIIQFGFDDVLVRDITIFGVIVSLLF